MEGWASAQQILRVGTESHPRAHDKVISYGTAGFRTRGEDLDHVMFRMGVLAVLRSKVKRGRIGVMITASHNPEEDNGVKLVDPMGEMLQVSWETWASKIANVPDKGLLTAVQELVEWAGIDLSQDANVLVARDTRPSSLSLSQAVLDGVKAAGGEATDYGLLTTPQLHYMVRCINTESAYGQPTEEGYFDKLATAFKTLRHGNSSRGNYSNILQVDGANGVGGVKVKEHLQKSLGDSLTIHVLNDGTSGKLNHKCGADFVKVQQQAPEGMVLKPGMRCASYDGDADRIVYYFVQQDGKFRLLDGDKIATLVAGYLKELVSASGLSLNLGLVQTAYANGSSTKYINEQLKVPVACVPTGVKHLHHKALDYDIGVYFEANGHGTVLFSDFAMDKVKKAAENDKLPPGELQAVKQLSSVIDVINQTVGDAISDMLLVETVLHSRGWDTNDWIAAYTDLANRLTKIKVKDRTVIETTDAERRTTSPAGLQEAVDKLVAKFPSARSFVRASGTEDAVRVYAESDTQANADQLAYEVGMAVYELAGGVGDLPVAP